MATQFLGLIDRLLAGGVEFIVVGGVALVLHGSARATQDLDICYERSEENLRRLAAALAAAEPQLRGAPAGLPFILDARSLRSGMNFTLATAAGDLDLLGELAGGGGYSDLIADSTTMELAGRSIRVLNLDALARTKVASGRLKDALDLAEIRLLRQRRQSGQ